MEIIKEKSKLHPDALACQEREKKYYQFFLNFLAKNGRTPTLQEFGDKFGFSQKRAGQLLARLRQDGYLLKIEGKYHHPYYPIDWISRYTKKIKQK